MGHLIEPPDRVGATAAALTILQRDAELEPLDRQTEPQFELATAVDGKALRLQCDPSAALHVHGMQLISGRSDAISACSGINIAAGDHRCGVPGQQPSCDVHGLFA